MPKAEHIRRSHGPSEYVITLTEDEMREFHAMLQGMENTHGGFNPPILPSVANALALLDPNAFPTPF